MATVCWALTRLRIRRVKCDETKPECQRCTKTGRKCEGYKHVLKSRDQSPAAAASFRNPSFLVVPQKPHPTSIPRNPSRSISPDSAENRSFFFFQTQTLPKWTEFFDSELWSQKILQLSHSEPAIKHGILALSTMHERFESTSPLFSTKTNDFAFVQYMHAVKHSNDLLTAHQEGKIDLEKVLIACIIFTCYENLAGNYRAANMHLRNGMRILRQHKANVSSERQTSAAAESIAHVLYRFDLQAMTFSDNASPYDYGFENPPDCPRVPDVYTRNLDARNDLVGLLRCMMWISGIANINPHAPEHPIWLRIYTELMGSFEKWESAFDKYSCNIPLHEQGDPKIYAGNTLLKMYTIMARTVVLAGAGMRTEMAWDSFVDSFKTIVDLAETIPPSLSRSQTPSEYSTAPTVKRRPSSFSPSFELSPIVPLFLTACRCRDPVLRRRAIAILLNCRRREGVWDSFGAGMVSLQCVKIEEGIDATVDLGPDNWLPLNPECTDGSQVPEIKRVQDVFVSVNMTERQIGVNYLLRSGETVDRYVKF
ncbi:hypothetical protein BS50DRAFT_493967 [Corynespora cassiicola Philippines]|uniref:Zn(2)-C6 fungal-type domain-containing protein n=1 Tax=Corynespora cassiicola Philippines TaxID=1448308 RepID=A0A2T2NNE7_CORCC|nr:hypothetical protein BS50DRAFT_493967 [Corynespora cassiicola Philippines]